MNDRLPFLILHSMNSNRPTTRRSSTNFEKALRAIQKMLSQNQLSEADTAISKLVKSRPDHAEAQYVKAVVNRLLNQPDEAFRALGKLHEIMPRHSRGFQEKGHLWMAQRNLESAIDAFEMAVDLDSALITSWKALIGLYGMANDKAGAARATIHHDRLKELPQELLNVSTLINEKRLDKAESQCRQFLLKNPKNVEAMRLLAKIGMELGITDDAESLLRNALEFEPEFHLGRFDYVGVLQKRQAFAAAFEQAAILRESAPGDYNYLRLYANTCLNVGRHEEAIGVYQKVLEIDSENPQILLMCGHAAKTIGDVQGGIDYYRRSYKAKPDYGDAFWSLANLKTYTLSDREMEIATRYEAADETSVDDRIHLCFALGKSLEDRHEFAAAFGYYNRGNCLKKQLFAYKPDTVTEEIDAQIAVCTPQLINSKSGYGHPAPDPIFIVGLPRSGSTLLEQILASHSDVDGTFELPNILNAVVQLDGRRMAEEQANYPGVLTGLNETDIYELGSRYIEETKIHRAGAPFFTDKMPNNFRHIGLIRMILPNAKIIDARREPMACCFSGFKQLFAAGQAYTYGLEEIGRYYRDYVRLMDHWDEVFPSQILRVQYEDVVDDLESQVARLLKFCGLEMQQACLEFHETDRLVRTPSSEQVRQPINTKGLQQWENFAAHLQPLKTALGG